MSSSQARQRWRDKRTAYVTAFCRTNDFKLEVLNKGYQLRIENVIDFYPTNGRWHCLPTGERGDWHTDNDLRLTMLEILDKVAPKTYDVAKGEQPIAGIELTGVNKVTEYPVYVDEASSWPIYHWYRNPIKWLFFQRLLRKWRKDVKVIKLK